MFLFITVEDLEAEEVKPEADLSFIPNYLANPPFPYGYTRDSAVKQETTPATFAENGNPHIAPPPPPTSFPLLSNGVENIHLTASVKKEDKFPSLFYNGEVQIPPECAHSPVQAGSVCQTPVSQNRGMFSPLPSNLPHSAAHGGPMQVFQPFFFTGAFPSNMKGTAARFAGGSQIGLLPCRRSLGGHVFQIPPLSAHYQLQHWYLA